MQTRMSEAVVFFPPFMTLARLFVEIKILCDNDPCKMPPAFLKWERKSSHAILFFLLV